MAGLDQQFAEFKGMIAALRGGTAPPTLPAPALAPAFAPVPMQVPVQVQVPPAQYMFPSAAPAALGGGSAKSQWNWKLLFVAGLLVVAVAIVVAFAMSGSKAKPPPATPPVQALGRAAPLRTAAPPHAPVYSLRTPGQLPPGASPGMPGMPGMPPGMPHGMPPYRPPSHAQYQPQYQPQPPPDDDSFMSPPDIERYRQQHLAHYKAQGMSEEEATVYVNTRLAQMQEAEREKRARLAYPQPSALHYPPARPSRPGPGPGPSSGRDSGRDSGRGSGSASSGFDDTVRIDTAPTSDGGYGEGQPPESDRRRRRDEDDDEDENERRPRFDRYGRRPPSDDDDDGNDRYTVRSKPSRPGAGKVTEGDAAEFERKRAALDASFQRGRPGAPSRGGGGGGGRRREGSGGDDKFTPL